jgi:hypothetical protein
MMALKRRRVQVALVDMGLVVGVTEATILAWRPRAAQNAHAIKAHRRRALPVTPVQRDDMGSFMRRKQAQQASPDGESPEEREDGWQGVWSSVAPELRLSLAALVGPRRFASAWQLIQMTAAGVWGVPCFCSDGFSGDVSALLAVSHPFQPLPRTGKPGRPQQPRKEPPPAVVDGQGRQGSKKKRQGRLPAVG